VSVSAAIMAGGQSRRMGQDKAWIDLGGEPLIRRVIDVMGAVADEVIIVANDDRYRTLGLRVIPDRFPGGGALGGIATGIGAVSHDTVLVTACDLPFLDAAVWRLLLDRAAGADVVVPVIGDRPETLHALYTKACLPAMERALAAGRLRVISFFDEVRVCRLSEELIRTVDPELRSFINVNTPEELTAAFAEGPERP